MGEFRALDEVALVLVALLAAHHHHAVVAGIQCIGDPDGVHRTEAAHRNDADKGRIVDTCHARHVKRRVGVVLAGQHQDAWLLFVLVGHLDRLDLAADGIAGVVLEGNHADRTGAHAGAATAAALFVEHREAFFILVDGAEGALHRAALALGAAFEARGGEGQVTRTRMRGAADGGILDGLDCLQRGAGGVVGGLQDVHRASDRTRGIDAGAARFVGEADEVRVGEAMLELRNVRALAVVELEHRGSAHRVALELGLFVAAFGRGDDRVPGFEIDAGIGHLTRRQYHEVGGNGAFLVEDQILERHIATIAAGDLARLALGEDHAAFLCAAVEVFAHARHAQILVHDHGVDLGVLVLEVGRLLDAGAAAVSGAVGQVRASLVALTGALDEDHRFDFLAVGALDRATLGGHGQGFESGLVHHVGLAAAELGQFGHIVSREACGLDDRADSFLAYGSRFLSQLDREAARCAGGFGDGRIQVQLDLRVGGNLCGHFGHARLLCRGVGFLEGLAFPQLRRHAAQGAGLLDDHGFVAGRGDFQRGRHARHAAADDQDALARAFLGVAGRGGHLLDLGAAHADVVGRHLLAHLIVILAGGNHPQHAFAQIGARHGDALELEGLGLGATRAGTDADMGHRLVGDVVPDHLHAFGIAEERMALDDGHLAFLLGNGLELRRCRRGALHRAIDVERACCRTGAEHAAVLAALDEVRRVENDVIGQFHTGDLRLHAHGQHH